MNKLLVILFFIISNVLFGQIKGVVFCKNSNAPIPYVNIWIENENIGTTSNNDGEFEIVDSRGKFLILSCLGYETAKIDLENVPSKIFLNPTSFTLNEVTVTRGKDKKENILGAFNNSDVRVYSASDNVPQISARLFNFDSLCVKTPYLKALKLQTYSMVKNAKFNIRFYSVGVEGQPDKLLYEKNIIGIAKKGIKSVKIDLSDLNILFPDAGLFVGYEWLIIEENKHWISLQPKDSNEKIKKLLYEPRVGILPIPHNDNSWVYRSGKWQKSEKLSSQFSKPYSENYGLLAFEITLTD
ncbi:carboxypeptidase-like regulatory domain-containing protein [Flavobacterium chuncheonense]|uniref:Carboxypeptidase-like regulatory domain-containing protein n=1 Tax=Flavobacterium chuncheonense TaxID=2026653 RepID=A0ABW5YMX5_9FLAO